MAVRINTTEQQIDIDDLGVTLRTLMAVGAGGYADTGRRKWAIRYKNAVIGSIQVMTTPKVPAKMAAKVKAVDRRSREEEADALVSELRHGKDDTQP